MIRALRMWSSMSDTEKEPDEILDKATQKVEKIKEEFKEHGTHKLYFTNEGWVEETEQGGTAPAGYFQIPKTEETLQTTLYKAPVEAELQKFGKKEAKQLELFGSKVEESRKVKVEGLNFSKPQDRAFNALQKLLDETDYQGNSAVPLDTRYDGARDGTYKLPGILINYSDFYEAYGLKRKKDSKFRGKQVEQAKKALEDLAEPWRITVERKKDNGKSDIVARETPLIEITKAYYDRDEEEIKKIKEGDTGQRADKLLIRYQPIFIDKIENFYLFKPYDLLEEINEAVESNRYSEAIPRFIWYLNTINYGPDQHEDYNYEKDPHKIGREKLAYRLRLDNYVDRRQWNYIDDRIEQACEVAEKIGFLLDYDLGDDDMVKLLLNPARCSRLRYRLKKNGKLPPGLKSDRG